MTNVELILARFGHEQAGRRMLLSIAGLPVVAWLWMVTCDLARRFEGGHLPPLGVGRAVLFNYLWNPVWIAIFHTFGMTGLHAFFGTLLASVAGVFAWSWARCRVIERSVGPEALREWRLGVLRASPAVADRVAAAERSPRPQRSSGVLGAVLRLVAWLVPVAVAALTIALVWAALAR